MSGADEEALAADEALFPERFVPGEMHGLIEAEHLARYWWASTQVDSRRVLDAGCGIGYGSQLLADAGAASVTGVDISDVAIEQASSNTGERVAFAVGDVTALPFEDGSFEIAVCFETIEHVEDQDRALRELRRVLTHDGLLLISSPNREVYEQGNPYHTHEYTPEELHAALAGRFRRVRLERQATWLASMVCDERLLRMADAGRALDVDVRKAAGLVPGRETFTIALASDATLPRLRALTVLAGTEELASWRTRARSAEQHVEQARRDGVEAAASYRSLEETYHALRRDYDNALAAIDRREANATAREAAHTNQQQAIRAELAAAADRERELSARADQLARELDAAQAELDGAQAELDGAQTELAAVTQSPVWRASAPLRALGRRGRAR